MAGDHGEIGAGGAIGTAAALFPILQGAWVKREAAGELCAAKASAGAHSPHIHIQRERELMHRRGLRFSLGDGGGFAHGLDQFVCYVFALHGLILRIFAVALIAAANAATSRF
jgi:hypothetical protein